MANDDLGVIATIQQFLDGVGVNNFSRANIHTLLCQKFPERDEKSLMSTVKTQIPGKMAKERGYVFGRDGDRFNVVAPKK